MQKKIKKNNKELTETKDIGIEVFKVNMPNSVAAKDESKDGVLKKLECED